MRSPWPCCSNQIWALFPFVNPFDKPSGNLIGGLSEDFFSFDYTTDGKKILSSLRTPRLPFSCVEKRFLSGLAAPVHDKWFIGLERSQFSIPKQLVAAYNLPPKFGLCLPSSSEATGRISIGGGPYFFPRSSEDLFSSLTFTPLLVNPVPTDDEIQAVGDPSNEYFIGVKSIKIDKKVVHGFNTSLLSIDIKTGFGGTKISTVTPYTVMPTSIYKAIVGDFAKRAAAQNIIRVAAVAPFGACFETWDVHRTRAGPRVPAIDLELEGNGRSVDWRIHGGNSMVIVKKNVMCLGFVDGGEIPRTSIVIGGLQLKDNLLEFDLTTFRLGFSSSLLPKGTSCA